MPLSFGEKMAILERTLPPLLLEKKKGYTNRSVYGGLEAFMGKNLLSLKKALQDTEEMSRLEELQGVFTQYSRLEKRERTLVVEDSLRQLSHLLAKTSLSLWEMEVSSIYGVGKKRCEQLGRLQLKTIGDLFSFLPRYYDDRRQTVSISQLAPDFQRSFFIQGRIVACSSFQARKGMHLIRATIDDGDGRVEAVWFNQRYLTRLLAKGTRVFLLGRLNRKAYLENRKLELSSPLLERDGEEPLLTRRLVPIYPVTEGLSQKEMQRIMKKAITQYLPQLRDPLPPDLLKKLQLVEQKEAIIGIHSPRDLKDSEQGRERLAFDELLILQLIFARIREKRRQQEGIFHTREERLTQTYLSSLSFQLTPSQEMVWQEIQADMEGGKPMLRLLQGDVGSGKTVIAALALLKALEGGYQGALMAPTAILAEQHYLQLKGEFHHLPVEVGFLSSGMTGSERKSQLERLAQGSIQLVIGTHSLFQEGVIFKDLGLIIIDEQHRFGVRQRKELLGKGISADLLVMTATPIPRSFAQTLYGDLDLSIIGELPPGRRPITTLFFPHQGAEVEELVWQELNQGYQIYYVCPVIQENRERGLAAVEKRYTELLQIYHPYTVSMIHGGMKREEKNRIMEEFQAGKIQILVSTTVIEVGVNNPRASVMIIDDFHCFGLSQLHQLRGRVGRGRRDSFCLLLGEPSTQEGIDRKKAILTCQDGFTLAEEDLRIRGPGDFVGERQHGLPEFRTANLYQDGELLSQAKRIAQALLSSGRLKEPPYLLLQLLLERKEEGPV